MSSYLYLLGNDESSDQLYPGVFLLNGHPYHMVIKPNSPEWDVSLKVFWHKSPGEIDRFSFSPAKRQVVAEFNFSVLVNDPNILKLKSRASRELREVKDNGKVPFVSGEHVDVYLQYSAEAGKIFLYSEVDDNKPVFIEYPVTKVAGFQVMVGQPLGGMQVEVEVKEILEGHLPDEHPFQVGNVIFRHGNIFDEEIMNRTNVLLIPGTSGGQTESYVSKMLQSYNFSMPPPGIQGQLAVLPGVYERSHRFVPIFAYAIENNLMHKGIIAAICNELITALKPQGKFIRINLPLIGAGGDYDFFDPGDVAQIYSDMFKHSWLNMEFIVSIPGKDVFEQIRRRNKQRIFPVISFRKYEKPQSVQWIEKKLGVKLRLTEFGMNDDGEISWLVLKNKTISGGTDCLAELEALKHLNIHGSSFTDYGFLKELHKLEKLDAAMSNITAKDLEGLTFLRNLDLSHQQFEDIDFLKGFKELHTLDLRANKISDISVLSGLSQLTNLCLRNNNISDISHLSNVRSLQYLDLSDNCITSIKSLGKLALLKSLSLSVNKITDMMPLRSLHALERLDVSKNEIRSASPIRDCDNLQVLKIDNNPLTGAYDLILNERDDNHYLTIINALLRSEEAGTVPLRLPVKVLVLGNHKVGKSSMIYYLEKNELPDNVESTHIVNIVRHFGEGNGLMPKMIFYDFGGQDYYHGLYRIFMSNEAIYLILWNHLSNINQQTTCSNNYCSQDFTVDYWLAQKRYIEQKKSNTAGDPLMLIQTYGDKTNRMNFTQSHNFSEVPSEFLISFYGKAEYGNKLSLNKVINDLTLQQLKASLDNVADRIKVIREEPYWYKEFINFIVQESENTTYESHSVSRDILPYYKRKENSKYRLLSFLKNDLEQLHLRGMLLYYPNDFPDRVWLNPQGVVQYIHSNILDRKDIDSGIIHKNNACGKDIDALIQNEIFQILISQKVVFDHKYDDTYIIPNFLPLSDESSVEMVLLKFGLTDPCFTLKFTEFIPFGLINQVICFFGNFPKKKMFWRDQLLFTINDNVKVLINVNFQLLEIKVYTDFIEPYDNKEEIRAYLFYGIMGLYWDLELFSLEEFLAFRCNKPEPGNLDFDKFKSSLSVEEKKAVDAYSLYSIDKIPGDLFITIDGKNYTKYSELFKLKDEKVLPNYRWEDAKMVRNSFNIPTYHFQAFTNVAMNKPLRCVISYSKKDVRALERFLYYLNPLIDDCLIEAPWYDVGLRAGDEWDPEIRRRFEQADIIFFLVTEHMMGTKYVTDFEIKCAIDRWESYKVMPTMNKPVRIVSILPVSYPWKRTGKYNLGRFTALPYTGMPVDRFPVESYAWNNVVESLAIMIRSGAMKGGEDEEVNIDGQMMEYMKYVQLIRDGKL